MSITFFTAASLAALSPSPMTQQGGSFGAVPPVVQTQDLDAEKRGAPPIALPTRATDLQEAPGTAPSVQRQKPDSIAGNARALDVPTRVQSLIQRPLVQVTADEAVVRGTAYKAILSGTGLTFRPIVGKQGSADVEFSLRSIRVGGEPLALRNGAPFDGGSALQIDRGAAIEAYHYDLDKIEQTFTFHELPGSGDLVVRMDVTTELQARVDGAGILFENELARVNYGRAFVLDASGEPTPIETTWTPGEIALTVPASYLAGATLPITIDPLISSFVFAAGTLDDSKPDVAYDKSQNKYFVAFEDVASATDADLYGFSLSAGGVVDAASFVSLAIGSIDMRRPRVAVNQGGETFMVVAAGLPSGDTNRRIYGQMVAVAPANPTGLSVGTPFEVNDSPGTSDCSSPDVAGNTFDSISNAFAVTWERRFSATDRDIHGRIVNLNETFATGRINIDNSGAEDLTPRISSSIGNTATADYYNVVWVRGDGTGNSVQGQILSRRLYFNGTFTGPFPASTVTVNPGTTNFAPVTTATLDRPLEVNGDLVHIVAYNTQFSTGASVLANVVTFGDEVGTQANLSIMEDADFAADQRDVDITTDGKGFMMVYSEQFGTGTDYDIYYCAGHLQDGPGTSFRPTLSERHLNLAFSGTIERHPAITSQFDGGVFTNPSDDDACAVWEDVRPTESQIEGATLDLYNNIPQFGAIAVGTQYCEAATNSSGGEKGWLRAMALNQSIGTTKSLQAIDVTANAFGYLLVANTSGYVTNPAGARGNLCVLGGGRYVNQIANSGTGRTLTSTVDPLNVPQPTGFTSIAAGQTWYFQYWHRDVTVGGAATSNFTNAVSLTFTP
ncbi:hypothetical protein [Planctomycetes bacterium Poly30]